MQGSFRFFHDNALNRRLWVSPEGLKPPRCKWTLESTGFEEELVYSGALPLHKHENSCKCSVLKEFLFIPLFILPYFKMLPFLFSTELFWGYETGGAE